MNSYGWWIDDELMLVVLVVVPPTIVLITASLRLATSEGGLRKFSIAKLGPPQHDDHKTIRTASHL